MSFLAVIFFLFIFLVIAVPISMIQRVWRSWRNFRDYGRSRSYSYGNPYSRHYPHSQPERKKKIFDKSEGEYGEFEEIASSSSDTKRSTHVSYETEEQVSDAEWTEIK